MPGKINLSFRKFRYRQTVHRQKQILAVSAVVFTGRLSTGFPRAKQENEKEEKESVSGSGLDRFTIVMIFKKSSWLASGCRMPFF